MTLNCTHTRRTARLNQRGMDSVVRASRTDDLSPSFWMVALIIAIALGVAPLVGCSPPDSSEIRPAASDTKTKKIHVEVSVQFHGLEKDLVREIEIESDQSVFDALSLAVGGEVVHTGSQDTLLVMSIKGVANGGAGSDNWTFRVNGKLGSTSSGVAMLSDGDHVLWNYGEYSPVEGGDTL